MAEENKKKGFFQRLKNKYRLVVMNLFPNPFHEFASIDLEGLIGENQYEFLVADVSGRILFRVNGIPAIIVSQGEKLLNTLSSGYYSVLLTDDSGNKLSTPIIKY